MSTIYSEILISFRILVRNKYSSLILIITLGFGIGMSTAIFSLFYGIFLEPLPVNHPESLVVIGGAAAPPNGDALTWWKQNDTFENLCEYRTGGVSFTGNDQPYRVSAAVVSADFFVVFQVNPQQGRGFVEDDENQNHVAILSDYLWKQNFGLDPNILGRQLSINGITHTIVGVMSSTFTYPGHTGIWIPRDKNKRNLDLGQDKQLDSDLPSALGRGMIGRLKSSVSLPQARSQLNALFERLKALSAKDQINVGDGIKITSLQEVFVRDSKSAIWLLIITAGLLLLTAFANATNLLLMQGTGRQKEMAIRISLGASTLQITRQLLIEGLVISIISGITGMFLSTWILNSIKLIWAGSIPRLSTIAVNIPVLTFSLIVSILLGLLVNLIPARQIKSLRLTETLKEGGSRSSTVFSKRVRQIFIITEISTTMILLIGAGLAIQSYQKVMSVDTGIDPSGVLTFDISLPKAKYSAEQSNTVEVRRGAAAVLNLQVLGEIKRLPATIAVGSITQLPLSGLRGLSLWIQPKGFPGILSEYSTISGDYFQALEIPIVRGRKFDEQDIETSEKVIIVSKNLSQKFWGERDTIGLTLTIAGETEARKIVGVVNDIRQDELIKNPQPQFYLPYLQPYGGQQPPLNTSWVVKTSGDITSVTNSLRSIILAVNPDLPIFNMQKMSDVYISTAVNFRFRGVLLTIFAALSILIAVIGVYGLISYSVLTRSQEIGVRIALGATPHAIIFMILREGLRLSFISICIGIIIALGLNKYFSSLLYEIEPTNLITIILAGVIIIFATILGCILPAYEGSRVNPTLTLK